MTATTLHLDGPISTDEQARAMRTLRYQQLDRTLAQAIKRALKARNTAELARLGAERRALLDAFLGN